MANLPEVSNFDDVYQIETSDLVQGGLSGTTNKPIKNLVNRTKWLKDALASFIDSFNTWKNTIYTKDDIAYRFGGIFVEAICDVDSTGSLTKHNGRLDAAAMSCTKLATGLYKISFSDPLAGASYRVFANARYITSGSNKIKVGCIEIQSNYFTVQLGEDANNFDGNFYFVLVSFPEI